MARHQVTWFHGGVPGLTVGDSLLPPSVTGVSCSADYEDTHARRDRVYLAHTQEEAAVYASIRLGDVYEVVAVGPVEDDAAGISVHAESAVVLKVVERDVPRARALEMMQRLIAVVAP